MTHDEFIVQLADFIDANSKEEAIELLAKSLIAIARTQNTANVEYQDALGRVAVSLDEQARPALH